MSLFEWFRRRKKSAPELPTEPPIWLNARSNGEYFHEPTTRERRLRELVIEQAAAPARRLGLDRRELLASSMGMALTLGLANRLAGCDAGGHYHVPSLDECVARGGRALSGGGEFIFDVQTHHFDPAGDWRATNPVYASFLATLGTCGANDPIDCFRRERYAELLFVDSDTTVAVLSSFPAALCDDRRRAGCGLPLDNPGMAGTRDWLNELTHSERLVNHCQVMPNLDLAEQLAMMDEMAASYGVGGWKCYPAFGPDQVGFWLDDPIGRAFIERGLALGVDVFCVHKGLPIPGFDLAHNYPTEIGRVARAYPEAKIVVYHSAICAGQDLTCSPMEGPYDPASATQGIDTLLRSLDDAGIGPGQNVYAELGSCWNQVMHDPTQAAHVLGKLLLRVGEDNVLWGTDAILNGSPQPQIEALRAFEIDPVFQDRHGYPALTPARKAKIFGLNAARLYRIDPARQRCVVERDVFADARRALDDELGPRRWAVQRPLGPISRREFVAHARAQRASGRPA